MPPLGETPVTLALIALNLLVSAYVMFARPDLMSTLSFRPASVLKSKQFYRLITAGFVHVGLGHLAFNMITLYFFGPLLEMILGSGKFIVLYFGSEIAAHALTLAIHRSNVEYSAVGASGAISGVLFAYCLFFPFEKIYFFGVLPMWSIVFAVGYVVLSIYAMRRDENVRRLGGIAHEAHLGGALGGLLLTILLEPRSLPHFLGQLGF